MPIELIHVLKEENGLVSSINCLLLNPIKVGGSDRRSGFGGYLGPRPP